MCSPALFRKAEDGMIKPLEPILPAHQDLALFSTVPRTGFP
jgi:hypothetical protein